MNTNLLYIFTALEFIYIIYLIRNIYKIKKEFRKNVTKTCYSEYFKDLFDDKDTIKYSMRPLVDHRDDTLTGIMLCTHNKNDMYDEYTAEDMKQIVDKVIEKVRREIKEYDRNYHRRDTDPKVWELYERVENNIQDLGDFEIRYRKHYIRVYGKQSFFVVKLLKSKLQVEFGKEKDATIFKEIKGIHDISSKQWNHAFMFEIESEKDLDELFFILKRAQELL